jgi:cation diffusion facilitator CzcD-associated flavoprotein CzcO
VVIIGAGFGGLAAAVALRRKGIDDLLIVERADGVGGTWRQNTYPGAACDIQSHLYSFSFAPNRSWSRTYVGGHEKLPTGGHESAHSRPISSAHRRTRKCPAADMNLPRPT